MPAPTKPQHLPKKIHYIWVGGPIPEKYLRSIMGLAEVAKASGFEFNLWVDDEKNYRKTLNEIMTSDLAVSDQQLDQQLGIQIRNINELKNRMQGKNADDFYTGKDPDFPLENDEDRAQAFWSYVDRERIGSKNLAAASDLLRYEILRQEGGYYFDTDTEFPEINPPAEFVFGTNSLDSEYARYREYQYMLEIFNNTRTKLPKRLQVDTPVLGIKANVKLKYSVFQEDGKQKIYVRWDGSSNDIIAVIPNHDVMKDALLISLKNYKKLDETQYPESRALDFKIHPDANKMDVKRFPYSNPKDTWAMNRRNMTIEAAGPGALIEAMDRFWNKQKNQAVVNLSDFALRGKIAGTTVYPKSDQTWLEIKNKNLRGYDMESLPDKLFSSEKLKTKKLLDEEEKPEIKNKPKG